MKTFDSKCLVLAQAFLQDYKVPPADKSKVENELASSIQEAIEDWLDGSGLEAA